MGFDIQRFPNGVDEELTCMYEEIIFRSKFESFDIFSGAICGGVLQDPLQAPTCEHAFCQVNKYLFKTFHWFFLLKKNRFVLMNGFHVFKHVLLIEHQWNPIN